MMVMKYVGVVSMVFSLVATPVFAASNAKDGSPSSNIPKSQRVSERDTERVKVPTCRTVALEKYTTEKKSALETRRMIFKTATNKLEMLRKTYREGTSSSTHAEKNMIKVAREARQKAMEICAQKTGDEARVCRKAAETEFKLVAKNAQESRKAVMQKNRETWVGAVHARNDAHKAAMDAYLASLKAAWNTYSTAKSACAPGSTTTTSR